MTDRFTLYQGNIMHRRQWWVIDTQTGGHAVFQAWNEESALAKIKDLQEEAVLMDRLKVFM